MTDKPILIAGPTASGKSALAMSLAREFDGVIINADSCQVYRELRIVSARPSAQDEALVPHRLFGHVSGGEVYSTGRWVEDVKRVLAEVEGLGKRAIFVGGTGLYYHALLEGLSEIPDIDEDVRQHWRGEAARLGAAALHEILTERDPEMAARLKPGDTQRITRALEVIDGSGRSLAYWQRQKGAPVLDGEGTHRFVVSWERARLYERINERFGAMVATGGLDEVVALARSGIDPSMPVMRALGVPELLAFSKGEYVFDEAVARAQQQTRRYAKRQMTWLRGNMIAWNWLEGQEMKRLMPKIFSKIHQSG